jgi:DnaK suppressor protein
VRLAARQTTKPREPREAHKGKSDRKRTIKKVAKATRKAVGRPRARTALNGSGRAPVKAKKLDGKAARRGKGRQHSIVLPDGYRPSESEPFMNERQRVYFRNKLVSWKEEIVRQNRETLQVLHEDSAQHADLADRATSETDRALELRARDRQRKLIAKIDAALERIDAGTYGYCEETGEPIGLKRLDARPIATLSLEAQERHERREKVFREQ